MKVEVKLRFELGVPEHSSAPTLLYYPEFYPSGCSATCSVHATSTLPST